MQTSDSLGIRRAKEAVTAAVVVQICWDATEHREQVTCSKGHRRNPARMAIRIYELSHPARLTGIATGRLPR